MDVKKEIMLWTIYIIVLTATVSSLVLSFPFFFPFAFPFPFPCHCFLFLLFFFFFPLPFHFIKCTSSLRNTNGNNLREGYNYLKTMSHSPLSSVWKMHDFSICTAGRLRRNCLAQDSSENIHSCLFHPPKKDYYLLFTLITE